MPLAPPRWGPAYWLVFFPPLQPWDPAAKQPAHLAQPAAFFYPSKYKKPGLPQSMTATEIARFARKLIPTDFVTHFA